MVIEGRADFEKFGWHPAAFRSLRRSRRHAPARASSTWAPCRWPRWFSSPR